MRNKRPIIHNRATELQHINFIVVIVIVISVIAIVMFQCCCQCVFSSLMFAKPSNCRCRDCYHSDGECYCHGSWLFLVLGVIFILLLFMFKPAFWPRATFFRLLVLDKSSQVKSVGRFCTEPPPRPQISMLKKPTCRFVFFQMDVFQDKSSQVG